MKPRLITSQPEPPKHPVLLTVAEAKNILKVSESTVWTLIRRKKLETVKIGERSTRIKYASLLAVAEGRAE